MARPRACRVVSGTADTVGIMEQLTREALGSPELAAFVGPLAASGLIGAPLVELVEETVGERVPYERDEVICQVVYGRQCDEVLQSPIHLLRQGRPLGDCDDQAMLCAAALVELEALGLGVAGARFARLGLSSTLEDPYTHVLTVVDAWGPRGWEPLALDPSTGAALPSTLGAAGAFYVHDPIRRGFGGALRGHHGMLL